MRLTIGALMMLEGLDTGVETVVLTPSLRVYDSLALALIGLRLIVGIALFASGWMLYTRSPLGARLAAVVLLSSAALRTVELGGSLTPTNLFPTYRWPVILSYWTYVLVAAFVLFIRRPAAGA